MRITFQGAAGTVTGSRYLLEAGSRRFLVDAGLFQGRKDLRLLNWRNPSFDPHSIDAVLLTHAHLDHSGYLPRLAREGYRGPIYCTDATQDLANILLLDAAKLQEEDAAYANRKHYSKHDPALPLFTTDDAHAALRMMKGVDYGEWLGLAGGSRARFHEAGHILGSAFIEWELREEAEAEPLRVVFSGDIGRYNAPIHRDPDPLVASDVLVVESTYGDRLHDATPLREAVRKPIADTIARGGTVLIPSFAVARAQIVTMLLADLIRSGDLPSVPIHVDSPMAVNVTEVYDRYARRGLLDPGLVADGRDELMPPGVQFARTVEESKQINFLKGPRIIISASGMMTGGRVLHHAERLLPDKRNLVLLVGYQAAGTRGRLLEDGAQYLRMHGHDVAVRAEVVCVHSLSAHADAAELIRWVKSAPEPPRIAFVTHGEADSSAAFAARLRGEVGLHAYTPELNESCDLLNMLSGESPASTLA